MTTSSTMATNTAASAFITIFLANAPLTAMVAGAETPKALAGVDINTSSASAESQISCDCVESELSEADPVEDIMAVRRQFDALLAGIQALEDPDTQPELRMLAEQLVRDEQNTARGSGIAWVAALAETLID